MLPFTAESEPGKVLAETVQRKVSQCVAADFLFRCLGCSVARLVDTPARNTSREHLYSAAFQLRQGSEPRAQLPKVLQCVRRELVGFRIMRLCKVQMLPFTAESEPVAVFAENVQRKVSQCVTVVCLSFAPVQMPGLFCCAFGGYPCQKHL